MKIRAIAALAALLVQAAAAFSPAALPRVSLQRHASMASHTARPPLRRSAGRGGARIAMAAGGAPGGKKEEEAFEVTWEHEDGTTDTTTAEKLKDLKEKPQGVEAPGPLGKVKNFFKGLVGGAKMDKASLAKIGTSALLSYGFVSNLSHISCLIASWVIHGRKTGLSPLDAGQWPLFLGVYAAFYAVQTILRPVRFALSIAITPLFDSLVSSIQTRAGSVLKREVSKASAFGMSVFLVNVVGSFSYLFLGLFFATRWAGVPLLRTIA